MRWLKFVVGNFDFVLAIVGASLLVSFNYLVVLDQKTLWSGLLVVLTVSAVGSLRDRYDRTRMESSLQELGAFSARGKCLTHWDYSSFREKLAQAKQVKIVALSPVSLFRECFEEFRGVLGRAGQVSILMVNPKDEGAAEMAVKRSLEKEAVLHDLGRAHNLLLGLAAEASPGTVVAKHIDYYPNYVMSIVETENGGFVYLTINNFQFADQRRVCLRISSETDPVWYNYFQMDFERMWAWDQSRPINLAAPAAS